MSQDPHALAALLQAANARLEASEGLAEAARAALMQRIDEMEEVSQLSLLEAGVQSHVRSLNLRMPSNCKYDEASCYCNIII